MFKVKIVFLVVLELFQVVMSADESVLVYHVEFLAGRQLLSADEAVEALQVVDARSRPANEFVRRDLEGTTTALRPKPPEEVLSAVELSVSREALLTEAVLAIGALNASRVPGTVKDVQQETVEDWSVASGAHHHHADVTPTARMRTPLSETNDPFATKTKDYHMGIPLSP